MTLDGVINGTLSAYRTYVDRIDYLASELENLHHYSLKELNSAIRSLDLKKKGRFGKAMSKNADLSRTTEHILENLKAYRMTRFVDSHNSTDISGLRDIVDGSVRGIDDRLESIEEYLDSLEGKELNFESMDTLHYVKSRLEQNKYIQNKVSSGVSSGAYTSMQYSIVKRKLDRMLETKKHAGLERNYKSNSWKSIALNYMSKAAVGLMIINQLILPNTLTNASVADNIVRESIPAVYKDVSDFKDEDGPEVNYLFDRSKAQKSLLERDWGKDKIITIDKSEREGRLFEMCDDELTYNFVRSFDVGLGPKDTTGSREDSTLAIPTPTGVYRIVEVQDSRTWTYKGKKIFGNKFYRLNTSNWSIGMHSNGELNGLNSRGCPVVSNEVAKDLERDGIGPGTYVSIKE